jgi:S-DNA-T family DNA segregation ATPase FtsK/SpoIIIE
VGALSPRRRAHRTGGYGNPLWFLFPRLSIATLVLRLLARAVAGLVRWLWPYRRELAAGLAVWWLWGLLADAVGAGWLALLLLALVAAGFGCVADVRQVVIGWFGAGRVRRRLLAVFVETNTATVDGHPPHIGRVRATAIGYRIGLRLRPGQSAELLGARTDEFRAALRCRDIRIVRDTAHADRVQLDVVRTDPLSTAIVEWADTDVPVLSIWDPVHFGLSEWGQPVRLSLVERVVFIGGNRGAGKSSGINVLVTHAAKSPDVELLLIDPNRVQLGPWADRALVFADHRVDDAIDVVRMWRDEIDRRVAIFATLPDQPLSLTRQIGATHGLPVWLLVIDELAYHMSVAGTAAQQREFYTLLRDGVARGRLAGMGAIVATQRPTHDLIPTSLRDLFDIRIAYRTMTPTSSDVILGDGFARQGYCATDIGLNARGVCWLLADDPTPIRLKTVWIPPGLRHDLAVTTVWNRPSRPDQRPHLRRGDETGEGVVGR